MNGTAVDDWIGVILNLNACYPVAMDIVLLQQTLKEGKVEGERGREKKWEEEGEGRREGEKERRKEGEERRREGEKEGGGRRKGGGGRREKRRREGEEEGGGRREGERRRDVNYLLK